MAAVTGTERDRPTASGATAGSGGEQAYRGERLGLPPAGPGSVAGFGRRIAALFIDWFASMLVAMLAFRLAWGSPDLSLATLGVFALEVAVLTWLTGSSFGQRIVGVRVVRLLPDRAGLGRLELIPVVARTILVCLVVPPVVYDRDGRGLHDRAAASVVVRSA